MKYWKWVILSSPGRRHGLSEATVKNQSFSSDIAVPSSSTVWVKDEAAYNLESFQEAKGITLSHFVTTAESLILRDVGWTGSWEETVSHKTGPDQTNPYQAKPKCMTHLRGILPILKIPNAAKPSPHLSHSGQPSGQKNFRLQALTGKTLPHDEY